MSLPSPHLGAGGVFRNTRVLLRAGSKGQQRPRITHHDSAVLGATGDDLVIVGTPIDVQHWPRVAAHGGVGFVNPACLEGRTRDRAVRSRRKELPNPPSALSQQQLREI